MKIDPSIKDKFAEMYKILDSITTGKDLVPAIEYLIFLYQI